jgi:serine/threonine protein kinase
MARDIFKSLSEYLKFSQNEWRSLITDETQDSELAKQKDYKIGIKYMEMGRYEDAIEYLKKGTTSKSYRKDAYYFLAESYRQLNMIPLARKMYERLIRLDYNYKDVQERIRELDSPRVFASFNRQPLGSRESTSVDHEVTHLIPAEDRYQILGTIYEGARSRIYKVQDKLLGRIIALKQIDRNYPDRDAYLRQMKERSALDHPNILRIYDIDEERGQVAMEYVEGRNLRDILRLKGALTHDMSIYIAIQLVNGLYQAHLHGIVHHALTPEHILLTRQCVLKIIAFRALDSFTRLQTIDDPYKCFYIPPECFRRKELTVASNMYSFGVILYEMFTGSPPFPLNQIKAFIEQNIPLHYDESLLPPGVNPIIRRCLAISPEQRYTAVRTVGEVLIRWYQQCKQTKTHDEKMATYKDFLLMAWADGKVTNEEALFLTYKCKELTITDSEAQKAETEVKQELKQLLNVK